MQTFRLFPFPSLRPVPDSRITEGDGRNGTQLFRSFRHLPPFSVPHALVARALFFWYTPSPKRGVKQQGTFAFSTKLIGCEKREA